MNKFLFTVAVKVGGSNIQSNSATNQVEKLNKIFTSAGVAIGVVLLIIGILKLIMSFADENTKGKMDASIFLGVGTVFLGMSTVVNVLKVNSSTTVSSVTLQILTIIQSVSIYAGVALLAVSVFLIIMAYANEQAETMSKSSIAFGVSAGLLGAGSLVQAIRSAGIINKVSSGQDATSGFITVVKNFVSYVSGYIGFALMGYGVFRLVYSIRNEDSQDRNTSIKILVVGSVLTSLKFILGYFGI